MEPAPYLAPKEIREILQAHGLKGSVQRISIYAFLREQSNHPTVDQIYQALKDEIPTLSKTTVYNALKQLSEAGLVATLTIEENENRYDAKLSDHGHFKCIRCHRVTDVKMHHCDLCTEHMKDYSVLQRHIYFKGICPDCQTEKTQ